MSAGADADQELAAATWRFLAQTRMPFEQFFFDWRGGRASADRAASGASAQSYAASSFQAVRAALGKHEPIEGATRHPYFAGERPITMLIDEVEALWAPIAESDDWSAFHQKLAEIAELRAAYAPVHE